MSLLLKPRDNDINGNDKMIHQMRHQLFWPTRNEFSKFVTFCPHNLKLHCYLFDFCASEKSRILLDFILFYNLVVCKCKCTSQNSLKMRRKWKEYSLNRYSVIPLVFRDWMNTYLLFDPKTNSCGFFVTMNCINYKTSFTGP